MLALSLQYSNSIRRNQDQDLHVSHCMIVAINMKGIIKEVNKVVIQELNRIGMMNVTLLLWKTKRKSPVYMV